MAKKKGGGYSSVAATLGGGGVKKTHKAAVKAAPSKKAYKAPAPVRSFAKRTGGKVSRTGGVTSAAGKTSYAAPPSRKAATRQTQQAQRQQRVARKVKRQAKAVQRFSKSLKKTGGLAEKLDRGFNETETITPRQAAIVMESEGLPGKTFAEAIIPGESGFKPGVRNPDDNYPSLVQITPSVQSAETQAKFDQIASKRKGGYSNPIVAAKQAKVLAGDDVAEGGTSNYVADTGERPGHLPGGQKAARRKLYGEPDPKAQKKLKKAGQKLQKVVTKAEKVGVKKVGQAPLGALERTAKVAKKGQTPAAETGGEKPKKQPGAWAGSKRAVMKVVPKAIRAEGRDDKRTPAENSAVGGSSTSDHLTTNEAAYAADLPPDDAVAQKIAKRLGMESHTGTNEVTKNGYRYQLIWQDAGHYDHIHIGATWTGEKAPPGTSFGGPASVGGGTATGGTTTSAPTGATSATASAAPAKKVRRKKVQRKQQDQRSAALALLGSGRFAPEAEDPLAGFSPSTRPYAETVR
jgi:hypothetical protein